MRALWGFGSSLIAFSMRFDQSMIFMKWYVPNTAVLQWQHSSMAKLIDRCLFVTCAFYVHFMYYYK